MRGCFEMCRFGVSKVYALFVLLLSGFVAVSRPPGEYREAWHRYLSDAELASFFYDEDALRAAESLPICDIDLAWIWSKKADLTRKRKELHSVAMTRLFADVSESFSDPTRLWNYVRRFRSPGASGGVPLDVLRLHFISVFNRIADPIPLVFYEPSGYLVSSLDKRFTMSELELGLRELKKDTAPGPNGIGNDVLLSLAKLPECLDFFLCLFNACFESGTLPDPWRASEIFILFKGKGDVLDPNSYRGIALLDSCFKLYERLLYHRLKAWAFKYEMIPPSQFGFRPRSGTIDAVFTLLTLICKYVTVLGVPLFTALIDFKKAFPSTHRKKLIDKLD